MKIQIIVDRSKWIRGGKDGDGNYKCGVLLSENGHMCCLGFRALAGSSDKKRTKKIINGKGEPDPYMEFFSSSFCTAFGTSHVCGEMMLTNDDPDLSDKQRQKELKKLFKSIGEKIKFIN